jgi:voltage-gated potassium channel
MDDRIRNDIDIQRESLLRRFEAGLERPMAALGLVWLALLVVEFTRGGGPLLARVVTVIWVVFIADFLLKLVLAPRKGRFLRRNLLTLVSLALPALRVLRVLRLARAARALRGVRLLRLITSLNRGMRALGAALRRRGFGYALLLTLLVLLGGAAGMYAFEQGAGIDSYSHALWWTAMILVTMGSDYWPRTPEGRVLCLLLAVYGFSIFGYFTATLATFFVSSDAAAGWNSRR